MLALGHLVEAGSDSSLQPQGRKAKYPAQKRGVGDVLFFPAAAAPSEKESGPWESVGKLLRSPGCKRMAGERRFKDGTHWGEKTNTNRQLFMVDKVWLFLFHR